MHLPIRTVAAAGLLAAAAATAVAAAPNALAAGNGSLYFTPGHGRDVSPVRVYTSGPCPQQTAYMVVLAYGHGFPAGGQVTVTTNAINFSTTRPFSVPLQDTMRGFAADANTPSLQGSYRFEVHCTDQYVSTVYARYVGVMTFADPTHWSAPTPPVAVVATVTFPGVGNVDAGNLPPAVAALSPAALAARSGLAASKRPPAARTRAPAGKPATGGPSGAASPASALPAVGGAPAHHSSGWPWWLAALGGLVLLAGGAAALVRDRRHAGATATATERHPVRTGR